MLGVAKSTDGCRCRICGSAESRKISFGSLLVSTESINPTLHAYENHICAGCGVVFQYPEISDEVLVRHYNGAYRVSPYALSMPDKIIDLPIQIPWSGISFQRFHTFFEMIRRNARQFPNIVPTDKDTIIDLGAYQGMFLHAASRTWGCQTIAYDYNEQGIRFARDALGITDAKVAHNIYEDQFDEQIRFCILVHAFEHLRDPNRFLQHIRKDILRTDGYLYLEVPNVFASPLSDPTHFFTYSVDSLCFVLRKNGFEPIDVQVHGHPYLPELRKSDLLPTFIWQTDAMNISVIARPTGCTGSSGLDGKMINVAALYREIKHGHRRVVWQAVVSQVKRVAIEIARFVYYVVFVLVLERMSYRVAKTVVKVLRRIIKKGD
ncbi:MAG: hypothetical protein CMH81_00750 [Nitrospiraceae bacterium]|nr:hypothetical protein [Nitrospiraceae bacterium]